jgi:hypothetical protein
LGLGGEFMSGYSRDNLEPLGRPDQP